MEEALGFIIEYMAKYNITTHRICNDKQKPSMINEIPEGKKNPQQLSEELRTTDLEFVLDNSAHLEDYKE